MNTFFTIIIVLAIVIIPLVALWYVHSGILKRPGWSPYPLVDENSIKNTKKHHKSEEITAGLDAVTTYLDASSKESTSVSVYKKYRKWMIGFAILLGAVVVFYCLHSL